MIVNRRLLDLFQSRRLFHRVGPGERWALGDRLRVHPDAQIEPYSHIFAGPTLPRRLGAFSYSHAGLDADLAIGRYCSIAAGLSVMGDPHPFDWASSSPFSYEPQPLRGFHAYLAQDRGVTSYPLHKFDKGPPGAEIGNDVWIGAGVLLARGVTIGDGAVIGARSIVTRDVAPYAVMAGAPARRIRWRFPEPLIERFAALRWWRFGPDLLQPLDVRDPAAFLDRLEAELDDAQALDLTPLTYAEMAAAAAS